MNHNLLIVDDEYYVLTWLEEMFRVDFDMEVGVYTASSAYDALELLNRIDFHAVLTDISMPGMDGLELFRRIKGNWPHCKTVFLTGYRNFDNMYRIVNHKDVRYILKSEDDEVIMRTVREALLEYETEMEQEQQAQIQARNWEKVKLWFRNDLLRRLVSGEKMDEAELEAAFREAELPVSFADPFLVFFVRLEGAAGTEESFAMQEELAVLFQRNLPKDIRVLDFSVAQDQVLFFLQSEFRQEPHWNRIFAVSRGAMEYTQSGFKGSGKGGFSAVIESTPVTLQTLAAQIGKMRRMMTGMIGGENDIILHAEQAQQGAGRPEEPALNRIPQMKVCLESRKRKEFFRLLAEYGEELQGVQSMHEPHAVETYYSIAIMLLEFINGNQMQKKLAFEIGLYKLTRLDEHASWKEAVEYLFEAADAVFQVLEEQGNSLSEHAVARIADYIDSHLDEDLSLTRLAEIGGFNASYLSRLFKQTFQTNVLEYIFQRRIARAKELLADQSIMIQEVAARSGYQSANSFARMFRKATGLSPAEYREYVAAGRSGKGGL